MNTENRKDHADRIGTVVSYLAEHLEGAPTLDDLAKVAGISPFHFHRVYRAVTGETPLGTARRLRLLRGAAMLREHEQSVTDIAFAVGYESSQAFAKAFKSVAGDSPSAVRNDPDRLNALMKTLASPPPRPAPGAYEVKVVAVEPFTVIASRAVGAAEDLFGAYGALFSWAENAGLAEQMRGIYGIPIDDPRSVPADQIRFDCCFDFGKEALPEDPYRKIDISGGQYAVVRHRGPYEGLEEKYDFLYGNWLAKTHFDLGESRPFNHYLQDPESVPPEAWETDIYLPLVEG